MIGQRERQGPQFPLETVTAAHPSHSPRQTCSGMKSRGVVTPHQVSHLIEDMGFNVDGGLGILNIYHTGVGQGLNV